MKSFLLASVWEDPTMYVTIGLLVVLAGMIWLSSRRRRNMQSEVAKMHDELRPGQRVRTVGGVVGRIKEIREESPGFKTVLLETGIAKNPAFMLFDIQAIYGVVPEEGHTIDGNPVGYRTIEQPSATQTTASENEGGADFNAREYVEKRNNLDTKKSTQKKGKKS